VKVSLFLRCGLGDDWLSIESDETEGGKSKVGSGHVKAPITRQQHGL
jgi:hypothetical protein